MNNIQSQIERLRLFKEPGFIGTALQRKAVGETASTMERMLAENRDLMAVYEAADRYIHSYVEDGSFQVLERICADVSAKITDRENAK